MNDCPMTPELLRWIASTVDDATANRLRALADWLSDDRRRRRDLFAAAALTGLIANAHVEATADERDIAVAAWTQADELLAVEANLAAEPPMPEVER